LETWGFWGVKRGPLFPGGKAPGGRRGRGNLFWGVDRRKGVEGVMPKGGFLCFWRGKTQIGRKKSPLKGKGDNPGGGERK